jgi:hypothetical protein
VRTLYNARVSGIDIALELSAGVTRKPPKKNPLIWALNRHAEISFVAATKFRWTASFGSACRHIQSV